MLTELSRGDLRIYTFCGSISRSTRSIYSLIEFPELMKYKPKKLYRNTSGEKTSYWWSPYRREKRIQVLEEIITSMSKK